MYEYKFVKVELSNWNKAPKEDYHEIIHNHAKEVWKFVQIFAPGTSGYGAASYFEIIFEKPYEL